MLNMNDLLHIVDLAVCGPHALDVRFSNGVRKQVDLSPYLVGEVFEPLRNPAYFSRATLDPLCKTVVWPNGADLAPEALMELPAIDSTERRGGRRVT